MKIVIKTKNIKLTPALKNWIGKKINSLEKFVKIFQEKYYDSYFGKGKPKVECWVEVGRDSLHHQKGKVLRAEAQLRFPGRSIRSEAQAKTLREAIVEVKDELQRQLKQTKTKIPISLTRRRQRVLKKMLRLDPAARFKKRKGQRIREEGI